MAHLGRRHLLAFAGRRLFPPRLLALRQRPPSHVERRQLRPPGITKVEEHWLPVAVRARRVCSDLPTRGMAV